ncbi:uncharacterized protein LOC106011781 [Aplysia californica]|uniref:Uncharacterized protein LOC106011781 n=1 Tax=Aplysia californica TaxID=6500 RepID=A0ABM1A013_APLCA|nr:uncharacterized protein LOC106011781 [Aplysia californica]
MARCLVSVLTVLAVVTSLSQGQICPAVDACLQTFTSVMRNVGHDRDMYCSKERDLITCIEDSTCSQQTEKHRESELRNFKKDGQCDAAGIISPSLWTLALLICCTAVYHHYS